MTVSDFERETRSTPATEERLWQDVSEALASAGVAAPLPVPPPTSLGEAPRQTSPLAALWRRLSWRPARAAGAPHARTARNESWDALALALTGLSTPARVAAPQRCCQDWPEE